MKKRVVVSVNYEILLDFNTNSEPARWLKKNGLDHSDAARILAKGFVPKYAGLDDELKAAFTKVAICLSSVDVAKVHETHEIALSGIQDTEL